MQPEWELPLSPDGIVMELRNGGRMRIRPIRSSDASALVEAYEELSPQSRYYRFFTARPRLPLAMATRLTDIDHEDHFAWLVFDADTEGDHVPGSGVAAARLIRDDEPTSAEAAVTVLDAYHHRGIGRFLIELLVATAADAGIEVLRFDVLRENTKMRQLMTGTGASAHAVPGERGVVEFRLPVPEAENIDVPAGSLYRLLRHIAEERD
ncbi:MAG: GNAT family N-acetyltransferase [Actinomycetota bacterium]